ncbi:MAG: glycoside hydrolase family 3 C-terminal domain-containing protein [Clostridia bacterium]|nr:glycoside hydrolase family 3 C-terminal domain-containing protein [Clostridia bacterium]
MTSDKSYRLTYTEKAEELVSKMTFKEKVKLIAGNCKVYESMGIGSYNTFPYGAGGCERLGVPEMKFCDGPRGCVCGSSTCFPVTMARGATFDPELEYRVGRAIGEEIRAHGGNFYGGVCINLPYNPGGGRSQETYGEDGTHIGKMACSLVKGVQDENVIACIKHFAFNSMENSRFWVNVTADKRTEREVYLPHFKKCIDAGAAAVMSSYNRYNGPFNGANKYLLGDVLKGEWDFDGFVVSDFFFGLHSTKGGLNAGLDVEMNIRRKYNTLSVKRAIDSGKATQKQLDDACVRIVRTLLAFTQADNKTYPKELIASKEHIALAREVADKSVTLIKNKNGFLPLDPQRVKRIAVVGNLAKEPNIGDYGSSQVHPPYIKTIMQSLSENYPGVHADFVSTGAVVRKADVIKNADAVIIMCGMRHGDEGEYIFVIGGDRKDLGLKKREVEMIKFVSLLNKNTAAVVMGGNVIRMNEWKDDVSAILMAYYPGMEGTDAIADIIFGRVNPSGKLPFAIAKRDEDYPDVKWISLHQRYGYYNGYKKLEKDGREPDFPYGFGLSYTNFKLSNIALKSVDGEKAVFRATVKNTGETAGDEVVQLYTAWVGSAVDRPVKALSDFVRVSLEAGKQKTVYLEVNKKDLAYYDGENGFVEEDINYTAYIGTDEKSAGFNPIEYKFESR